AGAEVLAGRRDDEHARAALVVQRLHRVAKGREESRRHRVHALGAVELHVRDAAVVDAELEEVVHGVSGAWCEGYSVEPPAPKSWLHAPIGGAHPPARPGRA